MKRSYPFDAKITLKEAATQMNWVARLAADRRGEMMKGGGSGQQRGLGFTELDYMSCYYQLDVAQGDAVFVQLGAEGVEHDFEGRENGPAITGERSDDAFEAAGGDGNEVAGRGLVHRSSLIVTVASGQSAKYVSNDFVGHEVEFRCNHNSLLLT